MGRYDKKVLRCLDTDRWQTEEQIQVAMNTQWASQGMFKSFLKQFFNHIFASHVPFGEPYIARTTYSLYGLKQEGKVQKRRVPEGPRREWKLVSR